MKSPISVRLNLKCYFALVWNLADELVSQKSWWHLNQFTFGTVLIKYGEQY